MNFSSILIQGNIISTEVLNKIRIEDIRFQQAKDFNLTPNTPVRDEISLAWSLTLSHWEAFKSKKEKLSETDTGTTDTRKYWMLPLLGLLGFELSSAGVQTINEKSYNVSHRATNLDDFPVHIIGIQQSLDKKADAGGRRPSPHAMVQEFLNNQEHLYALVSNGKFLRLLRDATRLSRFSYLEFNLEQMMEEQLYAEFALLFRLLHASRMPQKSDAGADSILEYYHQEALAHGSRIRERLSDAVEISIKEIANGFLQHSTNEDLRRRIAEDTLSAKEFYICNLRVIYRLLFLMVIEERKLVFSENKDAETEAKRKIYYKYYSLQRICTLVGKKVFVEPDKTDLWYSLQTCFSLFEESKFGQALGIAPLGSGLFAPDALGVLNGQALTNQRLLNVLRYLISFESENGQWVRVNYADLDVEEFGSVYEGLLEYESEWSGSSFIFKKGKERSKSGSHYTPEELVKPLIQHSLDYLIQDKLKMADQETGLLSIKVCDVACGSGHILLSAARRIGFELAKVRSGEDQPAPPVLRHAIRDVIRNCIYGVDKNPLAVELCKVAMWLEAHEPGQPLYFLDHHIKCGDAIVGLAYKEELEKGIANEAFKTLPEDNKEIATAFLKRNKLERKKKEQTSFNFDSLADAEVAAIMKEYNLFKKLPEQTPEEIVYKENKYKQYENEYHRVRLKQLADAQVAQFFIVKNDDNKSDLLTDAEYRTFLQQVNNSFDVLQNNKLAIAETIARQNRFFHWFLEFPQVFDEGGFDCILGNPPFLGGLKISTSYGAYFLNYLHTEFYGAMGTADLVTYFYRRIYSILKLEGFQSLISTKSISQGGTREGGLDVICRSNGNINYAIRSMKWPGEAQIDIALVSIHKGLWKGSRFLNNFPVKQISSYLDDSENSTIPYQLNSNKNQSFIGSFVLGEGFLLSETEALQLIRNNPKNSEVIFPYINGEDLNNDFEQKPSRWVINFGTKTQEESAKGYPECFSIVESRVKPERDKLKGNSTADDRRKRWWQFARPTTLLYNEIKTSQRILLVAQTTKHPGFAFAKQGPVFSLMTVVFNLPDAHYFTFLQSSLHEAWAWKNGSTYSISLRYTPSDIFETFAFPSNIPIEIKDQLARIGEFYHRHRYEMMQSTQLGLTKTYNAFHSNNIKYGISSKVLNTLDPKEIVKNYGKEVCNLWVHLQRNTASYSIEEVIIGILRLRELHIQMDNAVINSYGWLDIKLQHNFYEVECLPENDRTRFTIHPAARKEILKRLLELNHQIHEAEVAEEETNKLIAKATKTAKKKKTENQKLPLLPMRPHTAYDALYSVQDVVHITNLHPKTVGRWMKRLYNRGDYEGITKEIQAGKEQYTLNFYSMHEFIVFADLRLNNKIPMDEILEARAWLKDRFAGSMNRDQFYPYTSQKVLDAIGKAGRQIIFTDEQTGDQRTLGKGNAQLNLNLLQGILKRIHYDKGMISRLYLSGRALTAIDPEQAGGRPCVLTEDGGITIDTIQSVHKDTPNLDYISRIFKISKAAVEDALEFKKASVFSTN